MDMVFFQHFYASMKYPYSSIFNFLLKSVLKFLEQYVMVHVISQETNKIIYFYKNREFGTKLWPKVGTF
jgi:hypothetical protein